MDSVNFYDLVIVGAGPAGLTASIYASCFHLKHIIIGSSLGGQLQLAPDILNYPGFLNISGKELTDRMVEQAKKRGGSLVTQSVTRILNIKYKKLNMEADGFEVETKEGSKYQCRSIILATGTERRKLNIPGEIEYTARGVHYCATCERQDYNGKVCAVVGGSNSAVQAAVELGQAAAKVYIIYRGSQLRGDPIWLEQIAKNKKIEVIYNTIVTEIVGDKEKVTNVILRKLTTKNPVSNSTVARDPSSRCYIGDQDDNLKIDRVFIEIGGVPGTALVIPLGVKMDPGGYIIVNDRLATNVPGIFAAGDLVSYGLSIEQISSAVGLGARAAASAFAYIKEIKAPTLWGSTQIKR